jgi:T5SS/PEP-CTERM-associated repeat protein
MLGVMVSVPIAHAAKSYTGAVSPSPTNWNSTTDVYVGIRNFGTVTVDSGDNVSSQTANVGYYGYGTGTVTIDGVASTWTNVGNLYLGYNYSTGILNINNGGTVTVGATTYVGGPGNGLGMIGLQGGSFSTQSLYASPSQVTGTGTISARGLVTDTNLMFDSAHGASQHVPGFGNVALNLNMSAQSVGDLGAGWTDIGSVTIRDGLAINSAYGYLGCNAGSIGTATVDGGGSRWDCGKDIRIGDGGTGTLNVSGGGAVSNVSGSIGNGSNSVGTVAISGTNSRWTNSNGLTVGNQGNGTLAITAGGSVTNSVGYLGVNSGSSGAVTVDGIGSIWTNSAELYLADHTQGSLKITNGGTVTDRTSYMGFLDSATADAIVDGPGSTWVNSDGVTVGYGTGCNGTLSITNGGAVRTFNGSIGSKSGATGTVTISGAGSSWTNSTANVYVGMSGTAALNVLAGGTFTNHEQGMGTIIADYSGSTGVATVDGPGSTWLEDDIIVIGSGGNGTLNVAHGGVVKSNRIWLSYSGAGKLSVTSGSTLRDNDSYIGVQTGGNGIATVDGAGSMWSNRTLSFGYPGRLGGGTLNVTNGGTVTTSNVSLTTSQSLLSVDSQSMLAVQLNRTYASPISGGTGTLKNDGVMRVMAGAGIAAGVYSPISAGMWTGTGVYQPFGGKWNPTSHDFTVSAVQNGSSNAEMALNLASLERVLVSDSATGWSLGAAFMPKDTPLHLTAAAMDPTQMGGGNLAGSSILGRWLFTADQGYTPGEAVYLSFNVGIGHSVDDFKIWRYDGSAWASLVAPDLSYDGKYASFTVTDLNGYAVTMIPEPSTLLLIGIAAISLLGYGQRWRHRVA